MITFVVAASGLKYVGVGTTALGWILCATLFVAGAAWLITTRPWSPANGRRRAAPPISTGDPIVQPETAD